MGEILPEMITQGQRSDLSHDETSLHDLGISKTQSSRYQQMKSNYKSIEYGQWQNVFSESQFSAYQKIELNEAICVKERIDYNKPPKIINDIKKLRKWANEKPEKL